MSRISVFDHAWIDLVFEGRNQSYGAYQLRRQDPKTTMIALFSGIALLVAAVGIPFLINRFSEPQAVADTNTPMLPPIEVDEIHVYEAPPKNEPKPAAAQPETTQPAAPAPSTQPTVALQPFVATSEPVEIELPNMEELKNAIPAATTNPGDPTGSPFSTTPGVPGGEGTNTTATAPTGSDIVKVADEAPQFPGGIEKFRRMVADRFHAPDMQSENIIRVTIAFVVEKDGSITNIKVTKDPGYGAGTEAIRVLKSIKTKWKPGKVKGQPVRTAYTLPIAIQIK